MHEVDVDYVRCSLCSGCISVATDGRAERKRREVDVEGLHWRWIARSYVCKREYTHRCIYIHTIYIYIYTCIYIASQTLHPPRHPYVCVWGQKGPLSQSSAPTLPFPQPIGAPALLTVNLAARTCPACQPCSASYLLYLLILCERADLPTHGLYTYLRT